MKLNYKGKVHPSPSNSSADYLSVLKLLPAAILALTSALTVEDQEVLAYMIRSRDSNLSSSSSSSPQDSKKKFTSSKKTVSSRHKPPVFSCDCFDCYTSYWFRWDSSPNQELIDRVIEAYETHLAKKSKKSGRPRGRHNSKTSPRNSPPAELSGHAESEPAPSSSKTPVADEPLVVSPKESTPEEAAQVQDTVTNESSSLLPGELTATDDFLGTPAAAATSHKGLARKVLPDVMGLFNSRLWSLWSPKV